MGTIRQEQTDITNRNYFDNGDFNIWQRGNSFATVANGTYTADRILYVKSGAAVHTISQDTDVPTVSQSGHLSTSSFLLDCTTADNSIAAGDIVYLAEKVEGYDWQNLAQRQTVISFWVKATKTGIYCVSLTNVGTDRSFVREYTVNATDTWEKKTVTFDASPSAGTWDYTTDIGVTILFTIAAGSTYQTTANAWQTGFFTATSNQVNGVDSTNNNFRLSQVQFESGGVPTPYINIPIEQEWMRCQRYYEKSYDITTAPGTNTSTNLTTATCVTVGATTIKGYISYKVQKRLTGTVTLYSTDGTAGSWDFTGVTGTVTKRSATVDTKDTRGFTISQVAALDFYAQGHFTYESTF